MKTLPESIAGANWRTTLSGIGAALMSLLTVIAALPSELGDLANVFPHEWKARIAVAAALAACVLKVIAARETKDAKVTGDGSSLRPYNVNDGKSFVGHQVRSIAILFLAGSMCGCVAFDTALVVGYRGARAGVTVKPDGDGKTVSTKLDLDLDGFEK